MLLQITPWMPTSSGVGFKRELGISLCECSTDVSKLKGAASLMLRRRHTIAGVVAFVFQSKER